MPEINLISEPDTETIKVEVGKLRSSILALRAKMKSIEAEIAPYAFALRHYQSLCKHPGQKTGYNERDGSWANPCPVCGQSY